MYRLTDRWLCKINSQVFLLRFPLTFSRLHFLFGVQTPCLNQRRKPMENLRVPIFPECVIFMVTHRANHNDIHQHHLLGSLCITIDLKYMQNTAIQWYAIQVRSVWYGAQSSQTHALLIIIIKQCASCLFLPSCIPCMPSTSACLCFAGAHRFPGDRQRVCGLGEQPLHSCSAQP